MSKEKSKPTDAEVDILSVLWELGAGTVRQVHERLGERTGYTSTLKLMQIMYEKRLLTRTARGRLHIYKPAQTETSIQRRLVDHLVNRAFGGSASKLIVAALGSRKARPAELTEIRRLLQEMEGD